ncbi:MAG: UDP-2,3-diacylglucosamine diphosphatase LpxI [Candidatus Omnitrophica bacterium]|nr:UDP-2,3-diacylglucosamine diphosphatase LpxI [Candidatus Omnitrophota bacterium]
MARLGLIAGNGKFPFAFAQKAKTLGYSVVAAGVKGDTSPWLRFYVEQLRFFDVGALGEMFAYFQAAGVNEVIMAGQVNPNNLFDPRVRLDEKFRAVFEAIRDRKADTIFCAIADQLAARGMRLLDSTFLLKDNLAAAGVLTLRKPTGGEVVDARFGREIAKAMGHIDVGQTVVVKEKAIVAVEAMEGTDQTILRGGRIARRGAVVVKMSKPNQDHRFDVPVVGPRTIKTMARVNAGCLVVEAGKTIILDQDKTIALAARQHICIIAVH